MPDPKAQNPQLKKEFRLPPGLKDFLPGDQEYFTYFKKVIRHRCRQSGFRRISTPVFESQELFEAILGKDKSIYTFKDPSSDKLALKADDTVAVARAYVERKMYDWTQPVELFYVEPDFRYFDKKNKLRQNYKFGVEVIGEHDEALVAQVIYLAYKIFQDLGIFELLTIQINNIGCEQCRVKYIEDLKNFYFGKERSLCEKCKGNIEENTLQLLACEEEDCKILAEIAPKMKDYLCKRCQQFQKTMKEFLDNLEIPYEENDKLIRLPYHDQVIFDFCNIDEDKREVLCGGGCYTTLIKKLGGPDVAGVGFSMPIDQIVSLMRKEKIKVPSKDDLHVFVAQLGKESKKKCLTLITELREEGIKAVGALGKGSMQQQLKLAEGFKVPYMVIMGVTEVRENTSILRNMGRGSQKIVPYEQVVDELKKILGQDKLDTYSPGEVLY